jgi:hypothetical protein
LKKQTNATKIKVQHRKTKIQFIADVQHSKRKFSHQSMEGGNFDRRGRGCTREKKKLLKTNYFVNRPLKMLRTTVN